MPMVMNLACVQMRMTPVEALVAATLNSASSLGLEDRGSLCKGKLADFIVLDRDSEALSWEHIIYQFGGDIPIHSVWKYGQRLQL